MPLTAYALPSRAEICDILGVAALRVIPPVEKPWSVELRGPVIVGRRAPADIEVPDALVSRRHIRIAPADDGWTVEDLGSANGTYVDGKRLEGITLLRDGSRIELGFWSVVFSL